MKHTLFVYGLDQIWVQRLRETYDVIVQRDMPAGDLVKDQVLILTSDHIPPEKLHELRLKFPETAIMYHLKTSGLRGSLHIHALAESLGIHFLSPRATIETLLDKLSFLFDEAAENEARVVGFFGSGMGVGVTSVAATFAAQLAQNQSVILLGLDLYHPGWYKRPSVSLDMWQPRLTGKVLQASDFDLLVEHEKFRYLPGNYDILSIQLYQEEEIEFLIKKASEASDVVLLDCGSVPESAGWYVGLQKASIRYFVSHPAHHHTIRPIMDAIRHLDIDEGLFQLIINRSDVEGGILRGSELAEEYGFIWSGLEIPSLYMNLDEIVLPLGKKELGLVKNAVDGVRKAFGLDDGKKGGMFHFYAS